MTENDPGPAPQTPGAPPPKRLYRSRTDRMLGGVCGGLAAYLNADPTLIRVLAVASIVLPGPSIIAYIVMWIIVPEEPLPPAAPNGTPPPPAASQ